jgi:hypothetical protein
MKLLPYRTLSPFDIVDGYALNLSSGQGGTPVSVSSANLSDDPVRYATRSTANGGWASYSHVTNLYPYATSQVKIATGKSFKAQVLGVMLYDVKEVDENGMKLLFDPVKRDELQCVVSGQAVPIARRGVFDVSSGLIDGSMSVGQAVVIASDGKYSGVSPASLSPTGLFPSASHVIGTVIGTGIRTGQTGADGWEGPYARITIDL